MSRPGAGSGAPTTVIGRAWAAFLILAALAAGYVAPRFAATPPPAGSTPATSTTSGSSESSGSSGSSAPQTTSGSATSAAFTADMEKVFAQQTTNPSSRAIAVPGRDGFYFLGDLANANFSQAVGRRVYSAAEVAAAGAAFQAQKRWLAARNIPLTVAIAPAKWSIYRDKLPEWTDGMPRPAIADQLLAAYPDLGIIDLRPQLQEARSQHEVYSRMNSHWTAYGGYVGFLAIYEAMRARDPRLSPLNFPALTGVDTVDAFNEFEGLAGIKGANPWTVPRFAAPLPGYDFVNPDGSHTPIAGGSTIDIVQMPLRTERATAPTKARVLLLVDSTVTSPSPYFAAAFSSTMMLRHWMDEPAKTPDLAAIVNAYQPDHVLYLMTERHLNKPFAPPALP